MDAKILTESNAIGLDQADELKHFRSKFHIPKTKDGDDYRYFCGNSLGLQPIQARQLIDKELDDWAKYGVLGHELAAHPWVKYHEFLTEYMAEIVGAKPLEVVIMNTLSVNLHLMMVSFYRPTPKRHKILIEYSAFPSDRYAVESQIKFHGYDPASSLIILAPDQEGSSYISRDNIRQTIEKDGDTIALILIGSVNYYSGQSYPIPYITELGHKHGAFVGFDLAHGAGNLHLKLHDDGPDFAVWCSYKYLNSGPGGLAGCFVHERHSNSFDIPRFAGWWGHDKVNRFKMSPELRLMPGAEGWQLSNPPILPMASLLASLEIFHEAGIESLHRKSQQMSHYLIQLLNTLDQKWFRIISPLDPSERGCQVSIQLKHPDKSIYHQLDQKGIIADWREPDVIRVAAVPLYNTYADIFYLYSSLKTILENYEI